MLSGMSHCPLHPVGANKIIAHIGELMWAIVFLPRVTEGVYGLPLFAEDEIDCQH